MESICDFLFNLLSWEHNYFVLCALIFIDYAMYVYATKY